MPSTWAFASRFVAPSAATAHRAAIFEYSIETPCGGVLALARPRDIVNRLGDLRMPVVACGRSHVSRAVQLSSDQFIVHPRSVGLQA